MNRVVVDTHILLWFLFDPAKLSPAVLATLRAAEAGGTICFSVITLVELVYLVGRGTFQYPNALVDVYTAVADPNKSFEVLPLTVDEARAMERVPRDEVPDMPDRVIAATAVAHNLPLASVDSDIRSSATLRGMIPVIW